MVQCSVVYIFPTPSVTFVSPRFLQVLFETGILHELVDCKVTQKMSRYNSKTAQEITNEPQHTAIKESFQQILKEEKELPWLHKCARAGDMDGARILMERHPDQLRMKDSKGGLPLYWAIMGGCAELVQMILSSTTADDVLDIGRMEPGGTALCLAASVCRSDLIPILVQYGADPDVTGSGNKTPLEYAIKEKDQKTIRTLFDAGASLPTDALCHSVITGHLGAFEAILNEETNVDKQVCHPFVLMLLLCHISVDLDEPIHFSITIAPLNPKDFQDAKIVAAENTQSCPYDNLRRQSKHYDNIWVSASRFLDENNISKNMNAHVIEETVLEFDFDFGHSPTQIVYAYLPLWMVVSVIPKVIIGWWHYTIYRVIQFMLLFHSIK